MSKILGIIVCLVLLFSLPVSAKTVDEWYQEQVESSGGQALMEQLPQDTKELLEKLGITSLNPNDMTGQDWQSVLKEVVDWMLQAFRQPLSLCGILVAVVIIYAWVNGMSQSLSSANGRELFPVIATLAACGTIIQPVSECITRVAETTESMAVFITSFTPVYAGALMSAGQWSTALSFQSVVLYAAQLLTWISDAVLLPILGISLGFGVIGAVTPTLRLNSVGEFIGKSATWILSLGTLLFSGLLSVQSIAGTAADSLSNRMMRFSISGFVPIVGNAIGDAFSTIRSCVSVLKATIGILGIATTAVMVLPTVFTCVAWNLCLSFCCMSAELFGLSQLTGLLKTIQSTFKCMMAIVSAGGVFLIVAITIVSKAAGVT